MSGAALPYPDVAGLPLPAMAGALSSIGGEPLLPGALDGSLSLGQVSRESSQDGDGGSQEDGSGSELGSALSGSARERRGSDELKRSESLDSIASLGSLPPTVSAGASAGAGSAALIATGKPAARATLLRDNPDAGDLFPTAGSVSAGYLLRAIYMPSKSFFDPEVLSKKKAAFKRASGSVSEAAQEYMHWP